MANNGYFRQSTATIVPNAVVRSSIFNAEFNALELAFSNTEGHTHDGSSGGGAPLKPASLAGMRNPAGDGFTVKTSETEFAPRAIEVDPATGFTVENGDGVSGNPLITPLATSELAAIEALEENGFIARTAEGQAAARVFDEGNEILIDNPDGVEGNPIFHLGFTVTSQAKGLLADNSYTDMRDRLNVPSTTGGNATGTWDISVSGNSGTATRLQTPRQISLSGAVSGSATFDGSGNMNIVTSADQAMPRGAIIMWSGSTSDIPIGFTLCNGANGTPDLRGRFIVGAGGAYAPGGTGGANSRNTTTNGAHNHTGGVVAAGGHSHGGATHGHVLTIGQIPSHSHKMLNGDMGVGFSGAYMGMEDNYYGSNSVPYQVDTSSVGGNQAHSHGISTDGNHTHGIHSDGNHNHSVDVRPPYYALCFIMKT